MKFNGEVTGDSFGLFAYVDGAKFVGFRIAVDYVKIEGGGICCSNTHFGASWRKGAEGSTSQEVFGQEVGVFDVCCEKGDNYAYDAEQDRAFCCQGITCNGKACCSTDQTCLSDGCCDNDKVCGTECCPNGCNDNNTGCKVESKCEAGQKECPSSNGGESWCCAETNTCGTTDGQCCEGGKCCSDGESFYTDNAASGTKSGCCANNPHNSPNTKILDWDFWNANAEEFGEPFIYEVCCSGSEPVYASRGTVCTTYEKSEGVWVDTIHMEEFSCFAGEPNYYTYIARCGAVGRDYSSSSSHRGSCDCVDSDGEMYSEEWNCQTTEVCSGGTMVNCWC
jgi:hypothetical protein